MQQQCSNGAVKRRDFPSVRISLSRGVPVSRPSYPAQVRRDWGGGKQEVTPRLLLTAITVNWVLRPPTSSWLLLFFFLPFFFHILSLLSFFPEVWPSLSSLRCHHSNPLLCCRTPPSRSLLVFSLPLSLSPIICSGSTVLNIDGGVLHPDPTLLVLLPFCHTPL